MRHKLLLADDSVTIQRVVELTFSGEDVQVVTVGDGEQAIARIPLERPDIVLADIGMPKRSGYDVAAFVKGHPDLAHIPVLLLAGAFEPVDEARAQEVHSDGVLVKPFEPQQVISRVRTLIASARDSAKKAPAPEAQHSAWAGAATVNDAREVAPSQPPAAAVEAEPRLDDYFERLDAAFAQLGAEGAHAASPPTEPQDEFDGRDVPTLEGLLATSERKAADEPAAAGAPLPVELNEYQPANDRLQAHPPAGRADVSPPSDGRNLVADMFAALFAVEQGEPAPAAPTFTTPQSHAAAVNEGLIDEVTRRVIERLAPDAANELVARIVSDVAERLIREEIAQIKSAAATRS